MVTTLVTEFKKVKKLGFRNNKKTLLSQRFKAVLMDINFINGADDRS